MNLQCNELNARLQERSEQADHLSNDLEATKKNLESMTSKFETLNSEFDVLNEESKNLKSELAERDKAFEEIMAAKVSLEERLASTSAEAEELNTKLQQQADDTKKREQGFTDHMKDVKKDLEQCQKDLEQSRNEVKQYQEAAKTLKTDLTDRLKESETELEKEKKTRLDGEECYNKKLKDLENQNQLLVDSLGEIRSDLDEKKRNLEEAQAKYSEMERETSELETQITSWKEEKRALLERCLNTERDLEEEKEKCEAMKKRFDDILSAMHELGREHSSMQVDLSKVFGRKWVDDSEAVNCTTCGKSFSVTVRKHHCRNCGLIFCSECSSKQAAMASSKKPVRDYS